MAQNTIAYKRKQYFVKPDLQTKYAFMFVLAIGVGINMGVILTLLTPLMRQNTWVFPAIYAAVVLVIIAFVAFISVIFTHKIAGPIYKIERTCRKMIDENDLSLNIQLRTGDELQELAEEINQLVNHVRNTLLIEQQKDQAIATKIAHLLQSSEGLETALPEASRSALQDLQQKLQNTTHKYKLSR